MTNSALRRCLGAACALGAACLLPGTSARANSVADFYKGKSISLIISVGPGDGMDLTARLLAQHWSGRIPGQPVLVPRNMTGAGHLRAANYLYNQAARDGTAIAAIIPSFVMQQVLGGQGVEFDAARYQWIGSSNASNLTVFVWHSAGVKNLRDVMNREILLGGTSAGSNTNLYPTVINNVLGTKFKIVAGYAATPEIDLAIERGEVQGRAGATFNTLMANRPDWVRDKKIEFLVQIGQTKEAGFEHVPLLAEFAPDEVSRKVLNIFAGQITLGRPYLAPPGVPADRVAALRQSFDATLKDAALLAEARKANLDISPTSGDMLQKLVDTMLKVDPEVLARTKAAQVTPGGGK